MKKIYPYNFCDRCSLLTSHTCPLDFKPNMKSPIRIKYRLKCFHCHQPILCPADVFFDKNKLPICKECYADIGSDIGTDYDIFFNRKKKIFKVILKKNLFF